MLINKLDNVDVNLENGLSFTVNGSAVNLNYRGFYNIYNVLAVFSLMSLLGTKGENFNNLLSDYKPQIGRMEEIDLGKSVILNLAKNPAGFNQAIETVLTDKRMKAIIIAVNAEPSDGMDVSWLWDVDFERLNNETLNTLSISGKRAYDLALRFKYSGINIDKITFDMKEAILSCLETDSEVCYVLVNYTALFGTQNILLGLKDEKEGKK